MANKIKFQTSVVPILDTSSTIDGNTYTESKVDENAQRPFGGKYESLTAYGNSAVCRWTNVVMSATSLDGLNDSNWTEAAATSDGTIPTTVYAVALEYVSTLGTVASVSLALLDPVSGNPITVAQLSVGEGVAVPVQKGLATEYVRVKASAYSNGVNEATVNVLLIGT